MCGIRPGPARKIGQSLLYLQQVLDLVGVTDLLAMRRLAFGLRLG